MKSYKCPSMKVILFYDEIMNDIIVASSGIDEQTYEMTGLWDAGRIVK